MAKNSNKKAAAKRSASMTGAMKFFVIGCIAELYLLLVQRFYVNGSMQQMVAWFDYLPIFGGIGVAILAAGAVLTYLWKADSKKRDLGLCVAVLGLFLAAASFLIRWNASVLTLLNVVVPVAMLLGILWSLYDRECALSLTALGITMVILWICRKQLESQVFGTAVMILAILYILVLVAVALLAKQGKLTCLLPAGANLRTVYAACGISAAAMAVALISTTLAYYVMWILAIVVFGLAVYYTVKQL